MLRGRRITSQPRDPNEVAVRTRDVRPLRTDGTCERLVREKCVKRNGVLLRFRHDLYVFVTACLTKNYLCKDGERQRPNFAQLLVRVFVSSCTVLTLPTVQEMNYLKDEQLNSVSIAEWLRDLSEQGIISFK